MSLEKSTEVCEKENDEHQFSVVSNEDKTITSDASEKTTCKSIPKHADKPLPELNTSVKENEQTYQAYNKSKTFKDKSENIPKNKQHELHIIKHKYGRLSYYFKWYYKGFDNYLRTLNKVNINKADEISQWYSGHKKIYDSAEHDLCKKGKCNKMPVSA